MKFTIHGKAYDLTREKIIQAMKQVSSNPIDGRNKHYVEINGKDYPIKQVIHLATGLPYLAFTASYAYRILARLGFNVHGADGQNTQETATNDTGPSRQSNSVDHTIRLAILLQLDEEGFVVASCPALPGCHSQGRTKDEAVANITEAIRGYLASMREHGESIPATQLREIEVAV